MGDWPFYALLGPTYLALKLVPFFLGLGALLLIWLFLGRWFGTRTASFGALLFALVSSACLAGTRLVTVLSFKDIQATTWGLFATEVVLTIVAAITWLGSRPA